MLRIGASFFAFTAMGLLAIWDVTEESFSLTPLVLVFGFAFIAMVIDDAAGRISESMQAGQVLGEEPGPDPEDFTL